KDLIGRGFYYFDKSSSGNELSEFHIEATIAALHCMAPSYDETDWSRILENYDLLYQIKPSAVVALNRAIASGKASGAETGIAELNNIPDKDKLKHYPFYPAALAEFYLIAGQLDKAKEHFQQALKLARNDSEKQYFERKLNII